MRISKYCPSAFVYVTFSLDSSKSNPARPFGTAYKRRRDAERDMLPHLNSHRAKLGLSPVRRYYDNSVFQIIELNYED